VNMLAFIMSGVGGLYFLLDFLSLYYHHLF
jgi:hypothetical protein